ncbi:MAG TPA: hypothetical protein VGM82_04125 [Gemmatimonadaceae bacterium]|jgi:hypothetical protein
MTGDASTRMVLRGIAIAIAAAAVIDPSVTSRRTTKPDVVVLAADSASDAPLADQIARSVAKSYTVNRGPFAGAGATIIAGSALPTSGASHDAPIFAVAPPTDRPHVSIEALSAPTDAPALSRARIDVVVQVGGARGKNVDITLRDGSVSLDRVTRQITTNNDTVRSSLSFIPPNATPTSLRIIAHVDGASDVVGDALIDVHDQKWPVLFYDPRPSWMSTFVRRAIERDPRFVATSRVVTSRDVNTSAGNPPGRLDDLSALSLFDAVVVGAPQALSANDIAGLQAFMRRRGGSVILLLDEPPNAAINQLVDVASWTTSPAKQVTSLAMTGNDSVALRAGSIYYPSALPTAARTIAGKSTAAVWAEPVGAGSLIVSGAVDAWQFRDPATSLFDRFWQTVLGDAANRTPAALAIRTATSVVAPGERFNVDATLRDEALDPTHDTGPLQLHATVGARADSGTAIRLWPQAIGRLTGQVRAPDLPGRYRVSVSVGGRRAELPFIVVGDARPIAPGSADRLADLVHATHGAIIPASQIDRLSSLLASAVHVEPRAVTWHPMRSAWWIFLFVLALSGEWWLRRKSGLP